MRHVLLVSYYHIYQIYYFSCRETQELPLQFELVMIGLKIQNRAFVKNPLF